MEDMVIPDVMEGRYLENFVLISQLEVYKEGGDQEWGKLGGH